MTGARRRLRAAATAGMALAALVTVATRTPQGPSGADPDRLIVASAAWAAWLVVLYLLLCTVVLASAAFRAEPRARAGAGTPRWLRRLVEIAVGTSVAASLAVPALADSTPRPGPAPAAPASVQPLLLGWPVPATPGRAAVTLLRPPAQRAPVVAPPPTAATSGAAAGQPARPSRPVVVRPGDCLWTIAARTLGPGVTPRRVAAVWPRWWAENRDVIGPDPDLIRPGLRLTPPSSRSVR